MKTSDSLDKIAPALVAAQREMANAAKNATNPHFRSQYADLAEIVNTTRPVLTQHGLSVVQSPSFADGVVTLETMILHSSGQWISTTCAAVPVKTDPQGVGSAITYLRRYSLAAACGIAQEDDDGEAAVGRGANGRQPRPAPAKPEPAPELASEGQLNAIAEAMHHDEITEEERGKVQTWLAEREGRITEAQARQTYELLTGWIAERTRAAA